MADRCILQSHANISNKDVVAVHGAETSPDYKLLDTAEYKLGFCSGCDHVPLSPLCL